MGYSPTFVEKMRGIVTEIRNECIDFPIKVVAAFDDTCMSCPHQGLTECEANEGSNEHVLSMDGRVITQLGLIEGKTYQKSFLVQLTAEKVKPDDLDQLCQGCSWLSYGVCKEGILALQDKFRKN